MAKANKEAEVQSSKVGSLTQRTAETLRMRIADGQLQSGEKLPTEKVMALEFGVSRTVVREAVAGLRADGLIKARHGVGVFVTGGGEPEAGATGSSDNPFTAASVLDVLELRMAVEVHAAGLAAIRRSWSQEERIWNAAEQMRRAVAAGTPTESLDLAFHRTIAEASNNPAFVAFFNLLGHAVIPSTSLVSRLESERVRKQYLNRCESEHFAIVEAISRNDANSARCAMEAHLIVSQDRFKNAGRVAEVSNIESIK